MSPKSEQRAGHTMARCTRGVEVRKKQRATENPGVGAIFTGE